MIVISTFGISGTLHVCVCMNNQRVCTRQHVTTTIDHSNDFQKREGQLDAQGYVMFKILLPTICIRPAT